MTFSFSPILVLVLTRAFYKSEAYENDAVFATTTSILFEFKVTECSLSSSWL